MTTRELLHVGCRSGLHGSLGKRHRTEKLRAEGDGEAVANNEVAGMSVRRPVAAGSLTGYLYGWEVSALGGERALVDS